MPLVNRTRCRTHPPLPTKRISRISWIPQPRPRGRPFQTINRADAHTVGEVLEIDARLDNCW
eukprot:scaffold3103_cov136-Cylindrotheca_fusiformis.AAC.27